MSNIDRAADVIAQCWPNGRGVRRDDSDVLARTLAGAGLLAPDLPEPVENEDNGNPSWFNGWVEQDWGEVELHHNGYADDEEEKILTVEEARDLAYALLAAADYAEEAGTDGQDV